MEKSSFKLFSLVVLLVVVSDLPFMKHVNAQGTSGDTRQDFPCPGGRLGVCDNYGCLCEIEKMPTPCNTRQDCPCPEEHNGLCDNHGCICNVVHHRCIESFKCRCPPSHLHGCCDKHGCLCVVETESTSTI